METNETNQLPPASDQPIESKKMVAGLCAILVGTFGVHKFILGYQKEGIIMVVAFAVVFILSIITCGIGTILFIPLGAVPLIEGIIYLTKTDEQFIETYQKNKKAWF